jgi:nitroimidazol reductase NimA-like FMN-containing flavoprotein (pyridoxamine 5'-phosphate oxidase superfamily)
MSIDDTGALATLTSAECIALLHTRQVGRLAVISEHCAVIFPVNYGLDGDVVVIRTHPGTMLTNANHANVSFEVDDIDEHTRSGWSVVVRGLAELVTAEHREELVERTKAAAATPWAPGEYGDWLRLIPQVVSGRRIVPGTLPPPFPDAAYL